MDIWESPAIKPFRFWVIAVFEANFNRPKYCIAWNLGAGVWGNRSGDLGLVS